MAGGVRDTRHHKRMATDRFGQIRFDSARPSGRKQIAAEGRALDSPGSRPGQGFRHLNYSQGPTGRYSVLTIRFQRSKLN
jgi:hypothetical protein